ARGRTPPQMSHRHRWPHPYHRRIRARRPPCVLRNPARAAYGLWGTRRVDGGVPRACLSLVSIPCSPPRVWIRKTANASRSLSESEETCRRGSASGPFGPYLALGKCVRAGTSGRGLAALAAQPEPWLQDV